MNLEDIKALYVGRFFESDSKYVNHRVVNIISLDDETLTAKVVLQRYLIGAGAEVYTNSGQIFNTELSYAELGNVIR